MVVVVEKKKGDLGMLVAAVMSLENLWMELAPKHLDGA